MMHLLFCAYSDSSNGQSGDEGLKEERHDTASDDDDDDYYYPATSAEASPDGAIREEVLATIPVSCLLSRC